VNGKNWQMQRLLVSTESAVSRLSTAEGWKHRSGPLTLAFTSARPGEDGKPEARVVVVGNCEFISNLSFDVAHNKALAVSAVQWLAGRDYNIRVESPEFVDRTIKLDAPQQYLIAWVCLLWLPLIWVVLATVVWRLRKQ
jgi:ABC-type uncharacterized transport system involved in gliding motility auxiliary subunit